MIIKESTLKSLDNSGALVVKCFHVFGSKTASLASLIMVSVKTFRSGKKVKKGEVYKAIVIQLRSVYRRPVGQYFSFVENGAVLWRRREDSPVGTRVRTVVPLELRYKGFLKIVLLAVGTY